MATTLIAHCDARLATLQAQTAALPAGLAALRATAQAQQTAVQAARQALQDAELALRRVRDALAAVEVPAAGDPLLLALQVRRIERAMAAAALLAAEESLLGTQVAIAQQQDELDEALRRQQQFQALRAAQQTPHDTRLALLARLAGARVAVQNQAAARLAAEAAAAETQLKQDLPNALLARLGARHQHLADLQARMATTAATLAQLQDALQGATLQVGCARRLALAEAAGAALADDAAAAVARATATLAALAARPPRLNAAEKAALAASPPATPEMSTRANALAKQADFDDKLLVLAEKDGERRRIHLQLLLDDPEDYPPAAGARKTAYDAAQAAFDAAQADFDTAANAYAAKHRRALDDWLAGVPEALSADIEAFLDARAALRAIDTADPAALRGAITQAEAACVDALLAAEHAQLRPAAAARAVQALQQWLAEDPGAGGRRLHQGLRGAP